MYFYRNKFVRLKEWASDRSWSSEQQYFLGYGQSRAKIRQMMQAVMQTVRRGLEKCSMRISSLRKPLFTSSYTSKQGTEHLSWQKRILDPQEPFVQTWNKIFFIACFVALAVDPLFFYIPFIDGKQKCLALDPEMKIAACVLRSAIDIFYIFHIILQFRIGFITPSTRVFGRGELEDDPCVISHRYLSSYFLVDILAILPIPQFILLIIVPSIDGPVPLYTKELLKYAVFIQYVPRIIRILPLHNEVTRTSGILIETAWAGAAFNLFLYMLASHAVGAFWYLFSIERKDTCWRRECHRTHNETRCLPSALYCGVTRTGNYSFLNTSCTSVNPEEISNSTTFNFGMFIYALESGVAELEDFSKKFFYCFWWGLRNLSTLGQDLKTSTYELEIAFAMAISIAGLVLFALLIGNMQKYLQSTTVRVEEMRVQRQDAELWMSHRMLPKAIRERIRRYEQYKWQETRGVEEEKLICTLPKDLRRDIKRHLCLNLLKRVRMFEKMDEQLLDAMCDRLKPVLYIEKSSIVSEGDPVDEMLFIIRGRLVTMTTNGGRTGFFNSDYLKAGDFCGEELLTWALDPNSTSNLPTSTRTVKTITEVEAFALMADDLKFVASQFRRLHSKQLQHTFRLYSQQWRTWAACFIQAAWHRYCRRKQVKALHEVEDKLQDALVRETDMTPSLGATIYASRFAANALRALRHGSTTPSPKMPPRLTPVWPQKPAEPDFTTNNGY